MLKCFRVTILLGGHSGIIFCFTVNNLVFRGPRSHPEMTIPMRTTVWVWEQMSASISDANTISPHTPLWGNPKLRHLQTIPDPALWDRYEIKTIQQIMPEGRLLTYNSLRTTFQLRLWMFFRYLQLHHALQSQFPEWIDIQSHVVERSLISNSPDRILSSLYLIISSRDTGRGTKLFHSWKEVIPTLTAEDWEERIQQYIPLMISAKDRYIQLKFLPRLYYTPQKLSRIYPTKSDRCPKCANQLGTFLHVVNSVGIT